MKIGGVLALVLLALPVCASPTVTIFYDKSIHKVSNLPTIFSVKKIDVSKSRRIESLINQNLQYTGRAKDIAQVNKWASEKIATDPKINGMMKQLARSYDWLEAVHKYEITKVPAVVLSEAGEDFVVYGETNVKKAIESINAYRVGSGR